MKKRANAFRGLKVADSLASAKVNTITYINDESFGFAVLDNQIVMVHGAFYGLYLQFLPSFHVDISYYIVREGRWQGGKTRVDINSYVYWRIVLHRSAVL